MKELSLSLWCTCAEWRLDSLQVYFTEILKRDCKAPGSDEPHMLRVSLCNYLSE